MSLSVFETPVFSSYGLAGVFCLRYVLLFVQTSAILELFTQTRLGLKEKNEQLPETIRRRFTYGD